MISEISIVAAIEITQIENELKELADMLKEASVTNTDVLVYIHQRLGKILEQTK